MGPGNNDTDKRLTSDIISDASLYTLTVAIDDSEARLRVTSRLNDKTYINTAIEFRPGLNPLRAFEEAVYDNPLLTADFHKVEFVIDTNRFFLISGEDFNDSETARRFDALWPYDRTGIELIPMADKIGDIFLVWGIDRSLKAFLQRTWNNPQILHRLSPKANYFALNNAIGSIGALHLSIDERRLDVVALNRDGILLVNTFNITTVDDATYYTLAVMKHLEFDNDTDRIIVGGAMPLRNQLIDALKDYVKMVLPENSAAR